MNVAAIVPMTLLMAAGPQIIPAVLSGTSGQWTANSAAYLPGAAISVTAFIALAHVMPKRLGQHYSVAYPKWTDKPFNFAGFSPGGPFRELTGQRHGSVPHPPDASLSALASAAHNPQVAQSILGDLLHGFFVLTAWVLAVALVVLVIAVLSGPYRWAVAIRSWVKRTGRSIAGTRTGDRRGQVVTWMASHAAGLQLAGAVVAGILLWIVSVSWLSFLIIGVLLTAYEVYLQRIKPAPPADASPAPGPGNQAGLPSRVSETWAKS
jgi:hypothetical protein